MDNTAAPFADRLRAARAAAKLTQADLAEKMAVTIGTVASWEQNRNTPHRRRMRRLLKLLPALAAGA